MMCNVSNDELEMELLESGILGNPISEMRNKMWSWFMVWSLKIFLQSLESEQNSSDQTMDFIVTPNATCKNNSNETNSEEKDILRNIVYSCEDIQTRLNICCEYTDKENVREKLFLFQQVLS